MEDRWFLENLLLAKNLSGFDDKDVVALARNAVFVSCVKPATKDYILREINLIYDKIHPAQQKKHLNSLIAYVVISCETFKYLYRSPPSPPSVLI